MEGATSEKIRKQVEACSSGALTYQMKNGVSQELQNETEIKCMVNEPLMVMGKVHITNIDGSSEKREKVIAFCRCGDSLNKPFCDGAHRN